MTNDIERLEPGRGCYAAFLTHKGKMLGDMRVLDLGDELLLDTERVALQGLFNMIRRFKLGSDVELHKRTLELGLLSLIGPDARRVAGAGSPARASTTTPAPRSAAAAVMLVRPTSASTSSAPPTTPPPCAPRSRPRAPCPASEEAAEVVRVEHGRPRYGVELDDERDPAGGRPQRARRVVHQGLLRRAGDRRAAVLPRQAEPPPARAAAVRAGCDRRRAAPRREGGRAASDGVVVSPVHGPIALAIVRREAEPGATVSVGDGDTTAEVVELPFRQLPLDAPDERRASLDC